MQLYFAELKKRDTLREEYTILANSIETVMDILKINLRIEGIEKPDYDEKLNKKQISLITVRTELMEQIVAKLQIVYKKIGTALIKGNATDLNLSKYKLQKSMIEPGRLKEALIEAVDEKYLKPALKAYGLPHGGQDYLGMQNANTLAFTVPGDTRTL